MVPSAQPYQVINQYENQNGTEKIFLFFSFPSWRQAASLRFDSQLSEQTGS
jgi:hypothetical protein